jgi:hypothetical protein
MRFDPEQFPMMEEYLQKQLWAARAASFDGYHRYLVSLSLEELVPLLAWKALRVDNEVQVYMMLREWAQAQTPIAQPEALRPGLRACVRVLSMPRSDITALLEYDLTLYGSPPAIKLLTEALLNQNQGLVAARPSSRVLVWDINDLAVILHAAGQRSKQFEWAGAEWYGPRHAK